MKTVKIFLTGLLMAITLPLFAVTATGVVVDETGDPFNLTRVVLIEKGTTGISDAIQSVKSIKTIENGQMVIIKNGVRYNALGAQL